MTNHFRIISADTNAVYILPANQVINREQKHKFGEVYDYNFNINIQSNSNFISFNNLTSKRFITINCFEMHLKMPEPKHRHLSHLFSSSKEHIIVRKRVFKVNVVN